MNLRRQSCVLFDYGTINNKALKCVTQQSPRDAIRRLTYIYKLDYRSLVNIKRVEGLLAERVHIKKVPEDRDLYKF